MHDTPYDGGLQEALTVIRRQLLAVDALAQHLEHDEVAPLPAAHSTLRSEVEILEGLVENLFALTCRAGLTPGTRGTASP